MISGRLESINLLNLKIKILVFSILVFCFLSFSLKAYSSTSIDSIIDSSPILKTAVISVSIRDINTENTIYSRNDNLLLHPASTLKAFVTPVIIDRLGKDYKLTTLFYESQKGHKLYIKLSGDPLLTSDELNSLFKSIKAKRINKFNKIIIDDDIIDDLCWGVGWMWDDTQSPYMPKYSAYNINHNLIKDEKGSLIPATNAKENFVLNLRQALKTNKIKLKGKVESGNIPDNSILIDNISHDLLPIIKQINTNSDNLAAETLFKIAGKDNPDSMGTTESGIEKFKSYYNQLGLKTDELKIVDASGVSHYNLMQTSWITLALAKISKTKDFNMYLNTLATPKEGTLNKRLIPLKGEIRAKTGTLTGISGLIGYITTKSDKIYSFAILTQNYVDDSSKIKELEDQIINEVINL